MVSFLFLVDIMLHDMVSGLLIIVPMHFVGENNL